MKILHIAPTPFFSDRGCHTRILNEITVLQNRGYDILLTTYHVGRNVENLRLKRIVNIPWYTRQEVGGSWHKLYLDLLLLWLSVRAYVQFKPDIIHGHLHEGALIGWLIKNLCSRRQAPVIFDIQGSLVGELETYGFFKNAKFLKVFFTYIEKLICKLPDYFVCSSESNAQFIENHIKVDIKKITCLPDGVLPEFFTEGDSRQIRRKLGIPKSKKVVLFTGSLLMSKGIDYLLDSIPKVIEQHDSVSFLIVGYPVAYSKKRVRYLMVEDFVVFTGRVDYFHLSEYLALGDIAVDPKVDRGGEGSGKLVNYMAAGLPVVCFDTLNNRTTLKENGFFAEPGNTEDFANKIKEALTNTTKAKAFGKENQKRVNDVFSWKKNGEILSEIYLKLINKEI